MRQSAVYLFAIAVSLLLSLWIDYHESIINPDAVCYLMSAEAFGQLGLKGAMHLCGQAKWPFYSALIYGLVQVTHLSYSSAAYLLDAFFSALSVSMFILIVKELGGSRRLLWCAAAVILLWHEFNSVREYIVRDHGFWAFYLTSLFFLLRFFRTPNWRNALGWSFSLLLATLFRIEGALFLLLIPFVSWFFTNYTLKMRVKYFLVLNLPIFLIGFALLGYFLLHPQETLGKLGRIAELTNQLQHGFVLMVDRYQATKAALSQYVLTMESARDAGFVLFLVLIVWYLINVISNVSWIYGLLIAYAWLQKRNPLAKGALIVLGGYLLVNLAITFGFLAERLFLSKRYLIAFSLVLILWVPFALDALMQKWPEVRHRLFLLFAVFFIFISSLGGIFDFGYSKAYIREAGDWLSEHVPPTANLYVNSYQLMYYSKHFGTTLFEKHIAYANLETIAHEQWKRYDYLALRLRKHEDSKKMAIVADVHLKPIQIFSNKRGDSVIIYKVIS